MAQLQSWDEKAGTSAKRTCLAKTLLLVVSLALGLVLLEGALRLIVPYEPMAAASELGWIRKSRFDWARFFAVDPEFGFRPILGTTLYNQYGTKVNNYKLAKRPGVTRLLFIGDSVTQRGRIVEALRRIYGDDRFEYWNAGVESFNTIQEVAFYKRYNAAIHPDHVILTFHPNDFETTPVAFLNRQARLVVYAPRKPVREINQWLFKNSSLYRVFLGLTLRQARDHQAIVDEVRTSLADLRDTLARDRIALSVLVFPTLGPVQAWQPEERRAHEEVLAVLTGLQIRHFDLLEPALEGVARGVQTEEVPGDKWHPSDSLAGVFADYLSKSALLAGTSLGGASANGMPDRPNSRSTSSR